MNRERINILRLLVAASSLAGDQKPALISTIQDVTGGIDSDPWVGPIDEQRKAITAVSDTSNRSLEGISTLRTECVNRTRRVTTSAVFGRIAGLMHVIDLRE